MGMFRVDRSFPGITSGKESANKGDTRVTGLILGSGRSPGVANGTTLPFSCLENPMEREAWQSIVHEATKSQT